MRCIRQDRFLVDTHAAKKMRPRTLFLAALMLAGRMVPLLILWWMADSTQEAEIAVG